MKNKFKCVICDIDGTLAIIGNRSPYNAAKAHIVDTLNKPVAETVRLFREAGVHIIFITGREERFRESTIAFINSNMSWAENTDYLLFMRANTDKRKDAIYKREVYEQFIEPNYNVLFALEDRNQMVDMYRNELNVTTFQVAAGNF